jgi:hypothetical protein
MRRADRPLAVRRHDVYARTRRTHTCPLVRYRQIHRALDRGVLHGVISLVERVNSQTKQWGRGYEMASDDDTAKEVAAYEAVTAQYRMDIEIYWTRSNFFLLVNAGLLTLVTALMDSDQSRNEVLYAVCSVGVVISSLWLLAMWSSYHWLCEWRQRVVDIDAHVNPHRSFLAAEHGEAGSPKLFRRLRPTAIVLWLPTTFIGSWVLLSLLIAS